MDLIPGQKFMTRLPRLGFCVIPVVAYAFQPGDELDSKLSLKPVNGGVIKTFGSKEISIQIGRKAYSIKAVKTEIPQTILGWDLFRKFSLGLEWNDYRDLFITEKKAGIKSLLKHLAIPSEEVPRIEEVVNSTYAMSPYTITLEAIYFQTECMKQLAEEASLEVSAISELEQFSQVCEDNLSIASDPEFSEN